ncbi:hypothetical protein JCM10450v2_004695 [Rhodotorula kratochvilovae]
MATAATSPSPLVVAPGGPLPMALQPQRTQSPARHHQPSRGRSSRPPSGVSSSNRLSSSNPSLLSLDHPQHHHHPAQGTAPVSPATTADPYSRYPHPHPHPHPAQPHRQRSPAHPASRSHSSLPPGSGSGSGSQRHHPHRPHRDRERGYDPDFDRAAAAPAAAARELFNPGQGQGQGQEAPPRPRRERELRDDGAAARRPRSKREAVDPADLGQRAGAGASSSGARLAGGGGEGSKESLESVETDFSGRTRSSGGGGGRRRRRREDGEDDEQEPSLPAGAGAAAAKSRQLFDPRRDDPLRFAEARAARKGAHAGADTRSLASGSVLSFASDATGLTAEHAAADDTASASASGKRAPHPAMAPLKRAYRAITDLEARVQEEHRASAAREGDEDASPGGKGVRIQGGAGGARRGDDEYWVRLASLHKQLADAHYSFLQLALDPRLPASLHSLAQRYNIPTRLWQVAFHQLLERMRHAVLSAPAPAPTAGDEPANVLEHLIEFIQYAYGHYSQLFEDPAIAVFRAAWIEQLGDLARYRMAVAGLASRMHAATSSPSSARLTSAALIAAATGARVPRPADAASIGQAALGDWELEEQETWREMARDWYAQGLAENPGTGRLQHHLALLSKGDEMRALYHYVKSLTAAHPYLSARESILPLFEDEHQQRRTAPDVPLAELFVHLHGMLFTKIGLDDFSPALARLVERLEVEQRAAPQGDEPLTDAEWAMLAVVNVAALLQYGADDAVLPKLLARDAPEAAGDEQRGGGKPGSRGGAHGGKYGHGHGAPPPSAPGRAAPQAIMVKRAEAADGVDAPSSVAAEDDRAGSPDVGGGDLVKQLRPASGGSTGAPEDDPLPFKLAQLLAFSLLSLSLAAPPRLIGVAPLPLPSAYTTLLCTFLAHLSAVPRALAHLERSVPWPALAAAFNALPPGVDVRLDAPARLGGGRPLPEDWCLRGMDWAGRQLFGRGYWREQRPSRSGGEEPGAGGVRVESEMDALRFDAAALEDDADDAGGGAGAAQQLAEGRWRRLALCAAWLVRNVPGFDYDARAPPGARFAITGALRAKMERWAREDEDAREAERLSRLALEERVGSAGEEGMTEEESEDEDDENEDDSEAVKELKARRRQLKAIIRSARSATRGAAGKIGGGLKAKLGGKAPLPKIFPGYTVLVFDTNILLTSITLFSELVAAECWTIVVPLAVITELDGLRRNPTALGLAAAEVIDYLELAVRGYSRYLKIQTSRGNYLKDLSIRNESIDFAAEGAGSASSHDVARTMDDVILRAVAWQREHFSNRVALVNPQAALEKRKVPADAAQAVLVTFDRNLRLKAGARGLDATDEKGLKKAVEAATSAAG